MTDKPLFENLDQHEATYAPEQLPSDSQQVRRVQADERAPDSIDEEGLLGEDIVVPGAAAGSVEGGTVPGQAGAANLGGLPAVGPGGAGEVRQDGTGVESVEDRG